MSFDTVVQWTSGHGGASLAIAAFVLFLAVYFVQKTFYAWYALAIMAAFVCAALTGGPLYFFAFTLGILTAFAEIIGKFRDEPLKSLQTPQAVLYHLLNGVISVFALKVYYLTFGETSAQGDQIKAVTTAGFGSMLLMRSKFFNAKVGDQDISFGPEQIVKVFLSFMERAIDRVRAQSRVDFVRTRFADLDFEVVRPYCETMLDAAQVLDDRTQLVDAIDKLASSSLEPQLKSYRLGFLLLDKMGEDFVSKLLETRSADWLVKAPISEKKTDGLLARLPFGAKDDATSFYFAYGSSMSTDRFRERLGWSKLDASKFIDATGPQTCVADGYSVVFNKPDATGTSAFANLVPSASAGDRAEGVLYQLTSMQLDFLDRSETGYRRQTVNVKVGNKLMQAQAYVAVSPKDNLKVMRPYLQVVLEGAREHQLSAEYIDRLEKIATPDDAAGQVVAAFERRVDEKASAI